MVGVSILPVAIYSGELYFLFGKEQAIEKGLQGYSDFGGGREDETTFEGAIREGCEELTGFFGNETQLREKINNAGGVYKVNHKGQYISHIFLTEYDRNLPMYFANNHYYLYEKMDNQLLKKTKMFEKIELDWMTPDDMKRRRGEFRPFYRFIVDRILRELPKITSFLKSKQYKLRKRRTSNKTQKTTTNVNADNE
jgi:hypothetical protein